MTTKEVLIAARKLISRRENWLQGNLKNWEGGYCAVGAVVETAGYHGSKRPLEQLAKHIDVNKLRRDSFHHYKATELDDAWSKVVNHNNTHDHECVLELFDQAIENV